MNEANIGRIYANMPVQFTVDAHPKDTFRGKVIQIRMNAQMTSNVVNYLRHHRGRQSRRKAVSVHDGERFVRGAETDRRAGGSQRRAAMETEVGVADRPTGEGKKGGRQCLWTVAKDGSPEPIQVEVGPTDGTVTEVCGDNVKEGMRVILGIQTGDSVVEQETAGGEDDKSNMPFMPKFPKKGPPKGPAVLRRVNRETT